MHPKYWQKPRVMAPLDSEGSAGGGESLVDAFASHFESSAPDEDQPAPAAETQDDAAARLAAEDAAKADQPEATQDDKPADDAAEPEKFTIEVDGKPMELTKTELAEHVKNGMRQSDYTKKTMELADQRKAVEAQQAEARAKREDYATKLDAFTSQTNYELNALRGQLTDELLQSDPVAYLQIQRTADMRQAQLQQAQREMQQITEQRNAEKAEADRLNAQDQQEKLLAKVPEWKDPAKAKAEFTQLKDYLAKEGFTEDGDNLPSHLQIALARKAMLYDALMARAKDTQATLSKAPPKVARTGTPAPANEGRSTAVRRFEQTGNRDDAAAVFAELFG